MSYERRIFFGSKLGQPSDNDPYEISDDDPNLNLCPNPTQPRLGLDDCVEVIPVFARPYARLRKNDEPIDRSAQIITGDVSPLQMMTPYERTQAEYTGVDGRYDNPFDVYPDDLSSFFGGQGE
jgi:hypothetical protein